MTPQEEERRGHEVRAILQSPLYREAYQTIRDNIVTQLSLADTPDDKRQRLNHLLIALAKIEQYMQQVMVSGTMAAMQIERDRTFAEKVKDRFRA